MMAARTVLALLLLATPAWAQEDRIPDGDSSSDSNTTCDAAVAATVDDDPDSPGGDWCVADNNNTNWAFTVTMENPTGALDNGTDVQQIAIYVRSFDEGQSGNPTIRVDIYDGTGCADLHETGSETTLTDAGFPAIATEDWTSAGLSSGNDVCVAVVCTKSGGSPGARNSCDIDAVEWRATLSAGGERRILVADGMRE